MPYHKMIFNILFPRHQYLRELESALPDMLQLRPDVCGLPGQDRKET